MEPIMWAGIGVALAGGIGAVFVALSDEPLGADGRRGDDKTKDGKD